MTWAISWGSVNPSSPFGLTGDYEMVICQKWKDAISNLSLGAVSRRFKMYLSMFYFVQTFILIEILTFHDAFWAFFSFLCLRSMSPTHLVLPPFLRLQSPTASFIRQQQRLHQFWERIDSDQRFCRLQAESSTWRHRPTRPSASQTAISPPQRQSPYTIPMTADCHYRDSSNLLWAPRIHSIQRRTLVWLRRDTVSYSRWSKFSYLLPEWLFHSIYTVSSQWVQWDANCHDSRLALLIDLNSGRR